MREFVAKNPKQKEMPPSSLNLYAEREVGLRKQALSWHLPLSCLGEELLSMLAFVNPILRHYPHLLYK